MKRTLHEPPHRWLIALLNLGFLTAAATLPGAAINWEPATYIASDVDVRTDGTAVYAYAWSGIASTVNGVSLAGYPGINGGTNVLAPAFSNYRPALFTSKAAPFSALSTVYSNILIGADYVLGLPVPVTLKNLTIGHNYTVQVWANDPRGLRNTRSETISSAGGNTNTLRLSINYTNTNPGGSGQYIIGNFSADATDQTFILNACTNAAQLNALQLRDVSSWSSITAQINLVFNGSFGTNAAGWDLTAPGERYDGAAWFSGGNPGGCLELDGLGEGSAIQYLYGLVPGSNYLCSWCGRGIAPLWAFIAVSVRDNNSGITYSGDKSSWEYFGFAFTAQSLTSSDMLGIRNYRFGTY